MEIPNEQKLIAYCLKQGYISMEQIKEILQLKTSNQSISKLMAQELGWDKGKIVAIVREAQMQDNQATDSQKPDDASQKFGKYLLVQKLGAGGMGVVYKAYHPELDTYFAIKTILASQIDKDAIRRFVREARVCSQLKHPNIIQVYDSGMEGDQHYLVMEYIKGKDLDKLIQEEKLGERRILEIIHKISLALDYAHNQGVIHRDIKPSNILIASNTEKTPYLMDFGLASIVKNQTRLTQSGQILGTLLYMSPEQACGKTRQIDGRSDIYSLGTVLYQMLTEKSIIRKGYGTATVIFKIMNEDPVPPSKRNSNISREAEAICLKCLSKEPIQRYQTARELAEDIERYLNGYPVKARPAPVLSKAHKWIKRHKALTMASFFMLPICLAGSLWLTSYLREKDRQLSQALELVQKKEIEIQSKQKEKPQTRNMSSRNFSHLNDDPELCLFLDELLSAIEKHDWDKILTFFDEKNYLMQKSMGIQNPQYILEGFGLPNSLPPPPNDTSFYARLNSIKEVTLNRVIQAKSIIYVYGTVKTLDGATYKMTLFVSRSKGRYILSPPVG